MVNTLMSCLTEVKADYELQGKDFMNDLVTLYETVRIKMAEKYDCENFGPVGLSTLTGNMDVTEFKTHIMKEKKEIKSGYDRIKEKIKSIRQMYRKAVTEGRRSGSGKLVCDYWEVLKDLWGGSPCVVAINSSITSLCSPVIDHPSFSDLSDDEVSNESLPVTQKSNENNKRKQPEKHSRLIDNKRKHMEKNLSSQQRDKVWLQVALDDIKVKEGMIESLSNANDQSNQALEKIADSISSVGKSIGDWLALLAAALSQSQSHQPRYPEQGYFRNFNQGFNPQYSNYNNRMQSTSADQTSEGEKRYHDL